MHAYAGDQGAWRASEFEELAQSFEEPAECFRDLFLGFPGEPYEVRKARMAAARDVLAELDELGRHDEIARVDAAYAAALRDVAPLWDRRSKRSPMPWTKGAA
ncbi:hypothetical protein DB35_03595 [Streptomyces abyssalis]|uniref:Uncharacterized protein n=1 Tax=Streptomyces abyssalis TaxID=933944 RepID=A0A1E7JPZ0_9ACTN|nr:hypothetical protein [Streptomyces abyssalis]OEU90349.1 hypothetical protein AN215_12710 [Streptomyces abyssalis]OEU95086.1 hypothetical protein DB35_03595 [Streptomyces abyssalis]